MKDRCRRTAGLVDVLMADGDLTADEQAHVTDCPYCARVLSEVRAFERALAGVGADVTLEPIADPAAPLIAHEFRRPQEMSMRTRPSIGLVAALAVAGLAMVSLFILQPPGGQQQLPSDSGASAPPTTSSARTAPVAPFDIAIGEAAEILSVPEEDVLLTPHGAIAAQREAGRVVLVGVGSDRRSIPLTAVEPTGQQGEAVDSDVSAIVCAGGLFAGDAFVLSATRVPGTPSLAGVAARMLESRVVIDGVRTIVAVLDASAPRRTWALRLARGTGGIAYGGSFVPMPCDGSDPAVALASAAQSTADDRATAQRVAQAARALVPATNAVVGVELCGSLPLVRFWAPDLPAGGRVVIGEEVSNLAPDGPDLAGQRTSLDAPCRALDATATQQDYDALPDLEIVRRTLAEDRGFQGRELAAAYLGSTALVVEGHADPLSPSGGSAELEYVAVVRRTPTGWDAVTIRSADNLAGFTGIGGMRVGIAEGLGAPHVVVYGVPDTIDPVAVELEVRGTAYQYPIAPNGFLAVVPARPTDKITYRYLAGDGRVVASGEVPVD